LFFEESIFQSFQHFSQIIKNKVVEAAKVSTMVVEKVKNPAICKKFGSLGKLKGGEKFHAAPKKIGHSGEFPRNVFQDAAKKNLGV